MGGLCLPIKLYKDNIQGLTLHSHDYWYLFRNLYRQKQSLQVMKHFFLLLIGSPSTLLPHLFLSFPNISTRPCSGER